MGTHGDKGFGLLFPVDVFNGSVPDRPVASVTDKFLLFVLGGKGAFGAENGVESPEGDGRLVRRGGRPGRRGPNLKPDPRSEQIASSPPLLKIGPIGFCV